MAHDDAGTATIVLSTPDQDQHQPDRTARTPGGSGGGSGMLLKKP